MRRKAVYSQDFEMFWSIADAALGAKGSKKDAYAEWLKMIESTEDADLIIRAYQSQAEAKRQLQQAGQFFAPFPHLNRYIRDERFDDEIEQAVSNTNTSKARDVSRADEYRQYLEH
mgnify:CR=1 FL=1